jgi:hypothetical protein
MPVASGPSLHERPLTSFTRTCFTAAKTGDKKDGKPVVSPVLIVAVRSDFVDHKSRFLHRRTTMLEVSATVRIRVDMVNSESFRTNN